MEHLETIELDLEEQNELAFKVKVEGAVSSPAEVRLVCENDDVSYMFDGYSGGDDVVQFLVPIMKDKLNEGTYNAKVEVLIENRYFSPVKFQVKFKKAVKVVAESLNVSPKKAPPEVKVTASPIIVAKKRPVPTPVSKPLKLEPRKTLKERFQQKATVELDDEDSILAAAQSFVKTHKKV